ncbi:cytochrome protein [Emericellopsis cladophorae]|uniref:Cytochrome protein n=1 Tax=Emericellopsis cladophorae TaxID=2686198 RepID=A0A9P9Y3S3_9HYPO|nr:cytochrome protein [Emericellopsis cladophorae]KAI6782588.1 cytochrome protein [Emericellopsis cladophorae]
MFPDPTGSLGLVQIRKIIQAKKQRRLPDVFSSVFDDAGQGVHTVAHHVLGKKSFWTRDPENVKTILSAKFSDWQLPAARVTAFKQCWGGGIFGADGHQWKHSRALLRPAFGRSQIQDIELIEHHFVNLVKRIPENEVFDLTDLFPMFTMDIVTDMLFGETTGCLDPSKAEEGQKFASCFNYIMQRMSLRLSAPLLAMLPDFKLQKAVKFVYEFADYFINEALKRRAGGGKDMDQESHLGKRKHCFLDEIATDGETSEALRGEMLSTMVAGRDTTASLLGILWWHLPRRPDILSRLREEVASLGGNAPDARSMKDLKYLEKVVNEVLRLYPINPINSRTARVDTILPQGGGEDGMSPIFVAKGETVVFSSLAMHRRRDIFGEDAGILNPDRWDTKRPSTWEYIPFGGGPRMCLGQQLALLEVAYTTARLVQTFSGIEPIGGDVFVEQFAMALTSGDGCKVRLSRA